MHAYIIACVVIVISRCSDRLPEAGFCQNYLDLPLVNGWPCSCRVALRVMVQRVPCGFCTRFFHWSAVLAVLSIPVSHFAAAGSSLLCLLLISAAAAAGIP